MKSTLALIAVTSEFVGQTLSTAVINALVSEKYPEQNIGSLNLSDHAGVRVNGKMQANPSQARQYATVIFELVSRGQYKVLPASEHIPAPQGTGRAKSDPEAVKAEIAKLRAIVTQGKSTPASAPAVLPSVAASGSKSASGSNGVAVSK